VGDKALSLGEASQPEIVNVRAASGELAYSFGSYRAEFTKGTTSQAGGGAYLAVWEKDDKDHWQLAAEGFTPPQIHDP
jgi:ketosteroid isomerase-like protein